MKIVIVGDDRYLAELIELVTDAGHRVTGFSTLDYSNLRRGDWNKFQRQANEADLAIECVTVEFPVKRSAIGFGLGEGLSGGKPLLALAIAQSTTQLAGWLAHPLHYERVVGWAALPPISSRDGGGLVEVARGLSTADWAIAAATDFWESLGLEPVEVGDGPGLVRARVLCSLINEAVSALADGVASAEDIDAAMRLGNNYPKGLLAWADELGLDLVLSVLKGIHRETRDPAYRPHPLLKRKVWAGHLGKVSRRGFYEYDSRE